MSKTESFEFLNELALAFRAAENHPRPQCTPVLEGVRAVLAHLQSAGRLLADDEQRLTAEQVEDVRTMLWSPGVTALPAFRRLRALFPATELAEDSVGDPLQAWKEFLKPKPIGWYRTMELDFAAKHFGFPSNPVFEDRYTAPDGGKWQWTDELQWELRCYPPAHAEPAEERRSFPTIQDVPNNTLFHTHGGNGSSLFVRNQSGDLRLCLNAGPEWSKLLRDEDFLPSSGPYVEVPWSKFPQPPADPFAHPTSAEPAEEETKAEASAIEAGMSLVDWDLIPERGDPNEAAYVAARGAVKAYAANRFEAGSQDLSALIERLVADARSSGHYNDPSKLAGYAEGIEHAYLALAASSPVVPAPTETGPWQRIEDVPKSVYLIKDCEGDKWRRDRKSWEVYSERGFRWHPGFPDRFAPFVAAEEG